jgi:uncharacterized membrane protein YoaK (UPF0700 family)
MKVWRKKPTLLGISILGRPMAYIKLFTILFVLFWCISISIFVLIDNRGKAIPFLLVLLTAAIIIIVDVSTW